VVDPHSEGEEEVICGERRRHYWKGESDVLNLFCE